MKRSYSGELPVIGAICHFILFQAEMYREKIRAKTLVRYGIDPTKINKEVELRNPWNITIGANTYINSGQIWAGSKSKVVIGDWCAIGYNVRIIALTHDKLEPTGPNARTAEKDILIGDNVWIGDNVYIREGIKIGDRAIIGANSVVTRDVQSGTVVGGVPAIVLA